MNQMPPQLAVAPRRKRTKWNAVIALLLLVTGHARLAAVVTNEGAAAAFSRLPRTNLLVYHGRQGEVLPVKSKSGWNKRRAEALRGFAQVAGALPGQEKRCALD